MLRLHDLAPPPGAKRKRKRVARGTSGKGGKTAGRGTKGARARGTVPVWYEGGQLPLQVRIPSGRVQEPVPCRIPADQSRHARR